MATFNLPPARVNRVHLIEAADLAFLCGRLRARQAAGHPVLVALACNALREAAALYMQGGLPVMAMKVHRYGNRALKAFSRRPLQAVSQ